MLLIQCLAGALAGVQCHLVQVKAIIVFTGHWTTMFYQLPSGSDCQKSAEGYDSLRWWSRDRWLCALMIRFSIKINIKEVKYISKTKRAINFVQYDSSPYLHFMSIFKCIPCNLWSRFSSNICNNLWSGLWNPGSSCASPCVTAARRFRGKTTSTWLPLNLNLVPWVWR